MKKIIILFLILSLLFIQACKSNDVIERNKAYEKCTSVCSSVLTEDFTTLHLCNEECKRNFLNKS